MCIMAIKRNRTNFSEITEDIVSLTERCKKNSTIDPSLYVKYDVKRGLRDLNGQGVMAGLTEISDIHAHKMVNGKLVPAKGKLYYRGLT